ncbi:DUF4376 domain-containing protein [Aggregatibacter sp.]
MQVFLFDHKLISVINRKEEITDETCLITEQEADKIRETLANNGHFWRIDKYTVGASGAQPTENHKWNKETHEWEIDNELVKANLAKKRAELWEIIKQKRLKATRTGVEVTLPNGQIRHFHTDAVARQEYDGMGVKIILGSFKPKQWKTIENDWVEFNLDTFKALVLAIDTKLSHDYNNAEILKAQIEQSAEPESVDLDQGWSEAYV